MIGELLLSNGHIKPEQLSRALKLQTLSGHRLGTALVQVGDLGLEDLGRCLGEQHGVPVVSAEQLSNADIELFGLLPPDECKRLGVIPFGLDRAEHGALGVVQLAMMTPTRRIAGEISYRIHRPVKRFVVPELRIAYYIDSHLGIRRKPTLLRVAAVDASEAQDPEAADRRYLQPTVSLDDDAREVRETARRMKALTSRLKPGAPDEFEPTPTPVDDGSHDGFVQAAQRADLILEELREASSGRRIADALVRPLFEEQGLATLFLVRENHALGYATDHPSAAGPVEHLVVPLNGASMFQVARQSRTTVKASVSDDPLQKKIAAYLGCPAGMECCVGPMMLDGKVAYLLCIQSRPGKALPATAQRDMAKILARASSAMAALTDSSSLEDLDDQQLKVEVLRLRDELERSNKAQNAMVLNTLDAPRVHFSGKKSGLDTSRLSPVVILILTVLFTLLIVFLSGQSSRIFRAVTDSMDETQETEVK